MKSSFATIVTAAVIVALVVGSALWVASRLSQPASPTIPPLTSTPGAVAAGPSPSAGPVAPGFRLAGVASRPSLTYAVIEGPDDKHTVYHENEEIPGLGRLRQVTDDHVVIAGANGEFKLFVMPAATGTPTQTHPPYTPTIKPTPEPARSLSGRDRGSAPSDAQD